MKQTGKEKFWTVPQQGKNVPVLIMLAIAAGAAAGIVCAAFAGGEDLRSHAAAVTGKLIDDASRGELYRRALVTEGAFLLPAFLSGFSALGAVGLTALSAVRGFITAFVVTVFARTLGPAGGAAAALLFAGQTFLTTPFFISAVELSLKASAGLAAHAGILPRGTGAFAPGYCKKYLLLILMDAAAAMGGSYIALPAAAMLTGGLKF